MKPVAKTSAVSHKRLSRLTVVVAFLLTLLMAMPLQAAPSEKSKANKGKKNGLTYSNEITEKDRKQAAQVFEALIEAAEAQGVTSAVTPVVGADGYLVPDYFGSPNYAYSPQLTKFLDELPGLGSGQANALGQYIPIAQPDKDTYEGSDYYEIAIVQYKEKLHTELPETTQRGYVQLSTVRVPGEEIQLKYSDGSNILKGDGALAKAVDKPHSLGPAILSTKDRPVRIKFYNLLPKGEEGDLFIPVDTTVMGAGDGTMVMNGMEMDSRYTQNRANIHMHGNNTVWISDGTPHQWITPANDTAADGKPIMYPQGVSVVDVPDMEPSSVSDKRDGTTTLFYTNAQSARLMFYHDHSYGITRLNVYAGAAAPYLIQDQVEKDLIYGTNDSGVNPLLKSYLPDSGIPLIIQDKTFVDEATIGEYDPTWAWGSDPAKPATATTPYIPGNPVTGDLWYPHVYSSAQNPYAEGGANPFGRWMYGPWFWPPTENIAYGPVPNPYFNEAAPDLRPPLMPGTPNLSAPGESFMDTPTVNNTAYPYLEVDPKTYRFRILNAANDRFFNLSLYVADEYGYKTNGYATEVKMVPSTTDVPLPAHREQIMPDPALAGPDWIQIGNEGGFLPVPAIIPAQPTTWNLDLTTFNAGNVDEHSLLLGTAERADVLVDFSKYAGQTLILYNDAPAPYPANDTRYDYYTNCPDQTEIGGAPVTQPGKGPNTRTIMQIRVAASTAAPEYDQQALMDVFAKGAIPATATTETNDGVFATSQNTIIIPQAAYNSAYGVTDLPAENSKAYLQLYENEKTFQQIDKNGTLQAEVTLNFEPKALHDEMGEVYDEYGRMGGFLGLTSPKATSVNASFLTYGFASPPVDIIAGTADLEQTLIGSEEDGTQIWKITHNGVDTHTIHTHLFDSQLVNRVAWDGALLPPDANELGWKETLRVNPLEITFIAMRPKIPSEDQVPFAVPNSIRLIDPTLPEGVPLMKPPPAGWFTPAGDQIGDILNHKVNYGWEYVYHCHILSHEEMDMMHTMSFAIPPKGPTGLTGSFSDNGANRSYRLTWLDNASNETAYIVQRSVSETGPWTNLATLPKESVAYVDRIGNKAPAYFYRVFAINAVGDTQTAGFPVITRNSPFSNTVATGAASATIPAAPTSLTAGKTYTYRVQAINGAGSSAFSNTATVTFINAPSAPANVTATAVRFNANNARVTIDWTDMSNNETSFVIQRATDSNFTVNLVTATVKADTIAFKTGNLTRNVPFYFRIQAVNGAGVSLWVQAQPFPVITP